jgi:predicted ribosome quality control (RQC) complex YloA/Tae2 family protein
MKTLNECKNEMMHEWFEVPRKDYKTWDEIMDLAAETYASQYKSEVERLKVFERVPPLMERQENTIRQLESSISLLQEQLRLSEENNKVLLEKLKGGEETENNGEMEDYINITFSLNIDTFNRFLKALKCGDPELWAEIKDDIKERLEDACKRAKLKPHQSN